MTFIASLIVEHDGGAGVLNLPRRRAAVVALLN